MSVPLTPLHSFVWTLDGLVGISLQNRRIIFNPLTRSSAHAPICWRPQSLTLCSWAIRPAKYKCVLLNYRHEQHGYRRQENSSKTKAWAQEEEQYICIFPDLEAQKSYFHSCRSKLSDYFETIRSKRLWSLGRNDFRSKLLGPKWLGPKRLGAKTSCYLMNDTRGGK